MFTRICSSIVPNISRHILIFTVNPIAITIFKTLKQYSTTKLLNSFWISYIVWEILVPILWWTKTFLKQVSRTLSTCTVPASFSCLTYSTRLHWKTWSIVGWRMTRDCTLTIVTLRHNPTSRDQSLAIRHCGSWNKNINLATTLPMRIVQQLP
jgi:hypothetical protein